MDRQALSKATTFIKSWLADRYEEETIPGFVVAVSHKGQVLINEAYGYADLERKVPMTTGHVFRIASHSKTFTATAVMLLQEDGRLRIDDAVATYVPWLRSHADARWQRVTLRQLLSHGAGVIRDGLDSDYWSLERSFPDSERFAREIRETALVLEHNTKMKYSNYGYSLLGLVVENVSGQPYNEFVLDRTIRPLGLEHTFPEYRPERNEPRAEDLVTGYSRKDGATRRPIAAISTDAMSAATGFCSTSQDLCRYFTAQMIGSGQLLSDESKKEMQRAQWPVLVPGQPRETEYGLGFFLHRDGERQTFGHSGGFPGCITDTMADGQEGLVVTALTNAIDGPAVAIVTGVYKILSYFEKESSGNPEHDWSTLEGAYGNLWNTVYIVQPGDALVTVNSSGWDPLELVEKMEWVEGDTFKIVETSSGASEGELVHFHLDDGRVSRVTHTGSSMWPRQVWRQRLASRTRIG